MNNTNSVELIKQFPQCTSVHAAICDQNGILRGKRFSLHALDRVLNEASRLPLSLCNLDIWGLNIAPPLPDFLAGDCDGACHWTGRQVMPTNWLNHQSLLVPLTMSLDNGTPFVGDPRQLLAWVIERYQTIKLKPVVAVELEFYLTTLENNVPRAPLSPTNQEPLLPSSALPLSELEHFDEFISDVYRACDAHNIKLDAAIAECGAGQFEINLLHTDDALQAADDAIYFKRLVKNVARKHHLIASFMAKPYLGQPGNGMHVHFNLNNEQGQNIFANETPQGSDYLQYAVAGALQAIPESSLIFAPHLNSYRRYTENSHAPTHVTWGYENREAAIRIPGGNVNAKRLEHRVAGADANPYLVVAAILSACLNGLQSKLLPPKPLEPKDIAQVDRTMLIKDWHLAIETFTHTEINKDLLPSEFLVMFAACKQQELATFKQHMSSFELHSYLHQV